MLAFVEGRIQREFWAPRKDLDVRKLAALEALSRYGRAQGRMLGSITIAPNQWPTHAVIDWLNILRRVADVPQREQRLAEAQQVLRSRLSYQGTKIVFSTERDDYWWWLMQNGDVNTARLLLAVMDDPAWKDDMGRLASGFIARQQRGAWATTTANLWGGLALAKFSAKFESTPVTGTTRANQRASLFGNDVGRTSHDRLNQFVNRVQLVLSNDVGKVAVKRRVKSELLQALRDDGVVPVLVESHGHRGRVPNGHTSRVGNLVQRRGSRGEVGVEVEHDGVTGVRLLHRLRVNDGTELRLGAQRHVHLAVVRSGNEIRKVSGCGVRSSHLLAFLG